MSSVFIRAYKRVNPQRTPEESYPLRLSILLCVLIAEVTILAMGYYSSVNIVAVPLLTIAGYTYSWRARHQRNLLVKLILSILVIAASLLFLREMITSLYDTRLPLIKLLLWLQVLHSFDVPSRKDLKFSLASGATLIAAGAVLSTGMVYVAGLLSFSAAAIVALIYFYLSEEGERLGRLLNVRPRQVIAFAGATWIVGALAAIPLLLAIPQNLEARLYALPVSELQHFLGDFSGEVENPEYQTGGDPFAGPPRFSPDAYFGFNQYMDLRSRGRLSDDIVLKVRGADYSFYRGVVFDEYNGKGWEIGEELLEELEADPQPFDLNFPNTLVPRIKTRVETFYVEQDLPNIIFAGWKPVSLFFPADRIKTDQFQSIRSPYQLTEGTVYSVVTDYPIYDYDLLRRFPRADSGETPADDNYLQLPLAGAPGLDRVKQLAEEVTAPYDTRYDKVKAVEEYLKANYPYDLDVPPQDDDMDAVAYFLFEQKAGYCEHFASAMAVMLRSVDISTRVVTGYAGGEYNPFTALWEIRQSDAHAWVEVDFGAAGWVPFDPTPGFAFPEAGDGGQSPWIIGKVFSYLDAAFGDGPLGAMAASVASGARSFTGLMLGLPLLPLAAGLIAAILALSGLWKPATRLIRRRARRRMLVRSLGVEYRRQPVLREYLILAQSLDRLGLSRRRDETLRQFSERVSRYLRDDDFRVLSQMVERIRYGDLTYDDDVARARGLAAVVRDRIRSSSAAGAGRATGPA